MRRSGSCSRDSRGHVSCNHDGRRSVGAEVGGFRLRAVAIVAFLFAVTAPLSLRAQEESPEPVVVRTAIVPVVGSIVGIGEVRWFADVVISNPWTDPIDVILTAPSVPGDAFLFYTLRPGETMPLPDVVREAFSIQNALSPLIVQTLGQRSASVNCTVRGIGPEGAVPPQISPVMYSQPGSGFAALPGLRIDESFRTNVGLANLTDGPILAILSLQRITGRPIETVSVQLPPHSLSHRALNAIFPVVTEGNDLTLMVEFSGPGAYAYASVLRNETNAGRFVGP